MLPTDEPLGSGQIVFFIVAGYLVVFPIFWMGVVWLIGVLSGWQRLAQRYRATLPSSGQKWIMQSGRIGWSRYSNVLTLTASAEGLFMEPMWLFKAGHPRLFIPWYEFRNAEVGHFPFRNPWLSRRQVKAEIGFPAIVTVYLPAAVFEETLGKRVLVG